MTICNQCNSNIPEPGKSGGTGYARDNNDNKICYPCCAINDRKDMIKTGKACLYLTMFDKAMPVGSDRIIGELTNWPGTLRFPIRYIKTGRHNIAGKRYDFWFTCNGNDWHGVQYGDNTQVAHCKRIKSSTS